MTRAQPPSKTNPGALGPELHPGYEAAIAAQSRRLRRAHSILSCVNVVVVNDEIEEVDIVEAVAAACELVDGALDGLDTVSLRRVAREWQADDEDEPP